MKPTWNVVRGIVIIGILTVPVQCFSDDFRNVSPSTAPVTGSVQSVEMTNGNVIVKDPYGNTRTMQTTSTSTVTRAGADTKIPDLKMGDRVTIQGGTAATQQ